MSSNKGTSTVSDTKKISWITPCVYGVLHCLGFGNVVNGFGYFNGTQVIFSWVMMFVLYFVHIL